MIDAPSIEAWRDLYAAASKFKELACWNWMSDDDLFAVQDPVSGEFGYCCVMGALGESFALAVYLGPEGLDGFMKMVDSDIKSDADALEVLMAMRCLQALFEDRNMLSKQDLEMVKRLGLKFRGRNSWPMFRDFSPGYVPWYLPAGEAEFLTLCLHQAIEMATKAKENPDFLRPEDHSLMLARIPEKDGESWRWTEEWISPVLPNPNLNTATAPDEVTAKRLRSSLEQKPMIWETDIHYSPIAVEENRDDRPYYPLVLMCVERDSGFIFGVELISPKDRPKIAGALLKFFSRAKVLPTELAVANEDLADMIGPAAYALGIRVRMEKRLKTLGKVRASFE
ncbi:MAG: hypothetical protein Q8R28_15505, partial [Dehalococcoidia bacterium]|nr:hypothetical protein [Dehalococcoidia bacterium]